MKLMIYTLARKDHSNIRVNAMPSSSDLRRKLVPAIARHLRTWSAANGRDIDYRANELARQLADGFFNNLVPELRGNSQIDSRKWSNYSSRLNDSQRHKRLLATGLKLLKPIVQETVDDFSAQSEAERLNTEIAALVLESARAFFRDFSALKDFDSQLEMSARPDLLLEVDENEQFSIPLRGPNSSRIIEQETFDRQLASTVKLFSQRGNQHPRFLRLINDLGRTAEDCQASGHYMPLCWSALAIEAELKAKDEAPKHEDTNPALDAELRAELNLLDISVRLLAITDADVRRSLEGLDRYARANRNIDEALQSSVEPLLEAFNAFEHIFGKQARFINKGIVSVATSRKRGNRERRPTIGQIGAEAGWTHTVLYSMGKYTLACATAGVIGNTAYEQLPALLKTIYIFVETYQAPLGLLASDFPNILGWVIRLIEYVQLRYTTEVDNDA